MTESRILGSFFVFFFVEGDLREAPKPRDEPEEIRDEIIFSNPTKAPANTKRMLVVSMVYCSFLPLDAAWDAPESRPPLSTPPRELDSDFDDRSDLAFTVTVVPSIIFNRPCWTPSPETSRPCVMTAGLASLSTSSKKIIPVSHFEIE